MTSGELNPTPEGAAERPARVSSQMLEVPPTGWATRHHSEPVGAAQEGLILAIHEFLRVVRRFKWVIASVLCASMAIGTVGTLMTTKLYTSALRLEIQNSAARILQKGDVAPIEQRDLEFLRTQYELIQSRNIAERVVSALKLADDPEFSRPKVPSITERLWNSVFPAPAAKPLDRAAIERGIARLIVDNRVVKPIPGSRLVDVSYTDTNPQRAQAITTGLANEYIASIRDKRFEATAYAKSFLEDQLQQLRSRLLDSENALIAYGQQEKIIGVSQDKVTIAEGNLAAANATLDAIVTERIKNEQQYRQIENATAATLPQFLNDKVIADLRDRRNALIIENQEKSQLLRPDYPTMVQLNNKLKETDRQIADEIKVVKTSLKGAYEASLKQEEDMKARIDMLRSDVLDLQKRSIRFNSLKREAESNRTLYEDLLQRYKEVDVAGGIWASNVFIVDKAEIPTGPSSPNMSKNLSLALIFGLAAGLAGAFLLERLDNTVTKIEEFERVSGLPTLGVVPLITGGRTLQEEMENGSSQLWESYRSICTSLQFASDNGLPNSLFFTSAVASEGKSTSCFTVARHFSNLGLRVLLIDCDLRKPSLHKKLGLENKRGLTNYLTGSCSATDVLQSTEFGSLTFMSSGPIPPNASELLASPKLALLMMMAVREFELVIVDGPPIMGLADAHLLSKATDATVFTAQAGSTAKHSIRSALKRLRVARCNVIGAVLTQYEAKNEMQSYEYGYSYSYGREEKPRRRSDIARGRGGLISEMKALIFKS